MVTGQNAYGHRCLPGRLAFPPPSTCNRALGTSRFHHNAGHVGLRLIQSHGWPDRDLASGIGEAIMADYALKHGKRSMPAAWLKEVPYGRCKLNVNPTTYCVTADRKHVITFSIKRFKTCRFTTPYGTFYTAKRPISRCKTALLMRQRGVCKSLLPPAGHAGKDMINWLHKKYLSIS